MNERIKELAQESFFDEATNAPSDKMYTLSEAKMQKFAELIVRECVSIMEWQKISPKDDGAYNSALSLAQRNIKEQFGVRTMTEIKAKCDRILEAVVGPNAIDIWWSSPNRAFDMRPPKEMFLEDHKRVYRYLLDQVQR